MKFLYLMIASLIFFPSRDYTALPKDFGLISEDVFIKTEDGVKLAGWYLKAPESKGTLYFLHGNAGNISDRLYKVRGWIQNGYSVFLLDYRGYGASEGKVENEDGIYLDAKAGLKWLKEEKKLVGNQIILYGESIGTAPMTDLSSKEDFWALILEAPFTSFFEVAKTHYPFVPSFVLNAFRFDSIGKIQDVKTPVFIIHGEKDEICPYKMGVALFEKANEPKEIYSVPGAMHNDLPDVAGDAFFKRPIAFVEKVKK